MNIPFPDCEGLDICTCMCALQGHLGEVGDSESYIHSRGVCLPFAPAFSRFGEIRHMYIVVVVRFYLSFISIQQQGSLQVQSNPLNKSADNGLARLPMVKSASWFNFQWTKPPNLSADLTAASTPQKRRSVEPFSLT